MFVVGREEAVTFRLRESNSPGTIAFAVSGAFYAVGQRAPALWILGAGIFLSVLSIFIHWRDDTPRSEATDESSIFERETSTPAPRPEVSATPPAPERPRKQSRPRRSEPEEYEPNERERQILWYLFQPNVDRNLGSIVAGLRFQYSEEAVHYLENLAGHGYVRFPPRWSVTNAFPEYRLTPKGREYMMKNLLP
jgi:hypothetical protein